METQQAGATRCRLEDISTEWAIVRDPARFVLRYASAIRRYLGALVANPHDAEGLAQDFFLRVTQHGFVHTRQTGGRFRDYLKAALRHAALNYLRGARRPRPVGLDALRGAVPDKDQLPADQA